VFFRGVGACPKIYRRVAARKSLFLQGCHLGLAERVSATVGLCFRETVFRGAEPGQREHRSYYKQADIEL
jgi:hypothetical protein